LAIYDSPTDCVSGWPPATSDIHPAAISPLNLTYTRRSHAERTVLVRQQPWHQNTALPTLKTLGKISGTWTCFQIIQLSMTDQNF